MPRKSGDAGNATSDDGELKGRFIELVIIYNSMGMIANRDDFMR